MKYRFSALAFLICALLLLGAAQAAVIPATIFGLNNEEPFRVKYAESNNELKDPAVRDQVGVYVLTKGGDLHKIVSGQILPHNVQGSILARFQTKEYDGRHAMLAILDNKLRIFSIASSLENAGSVLEIGSPQAALHDAVTDALVQLPPIVAAEDVHVALGHNNEAGQTILISVKLPSASVQGEGVTIAGFLKSGKSAEDPVLSLGNKLYVLDYRFHDQSDLLDFFSLDVDSGSDVLQDTRLVSPLFAKSLTVSREGDSNAVLEWREDLKQKLAAFYKISANGDKNSEEYESLPWIDVQDGARAIPSLPESSSRYKIGGQIFTLDQEYDFLTGNNRVTLTASQNREKVVFPGRIDLLHLGREKEERVAFPEPQGLLFYVEGHPHLAFLDAKTRELRTLPLPLNTEDVENGVPRKAHLALHWSGNVLNAFVTEYFNKTIQTTKVYLIDAGEGEEPPHLKRVLDINGEFYSDAAEFRARVTAVPSQKGIYFDDVLPNLNDSGKYAKEAQQRSNRRRLDVQASSKEHFVYWYPNTATERFRLEWFSDTLYIADAGGTAGGRVAVGKADYDEVSFIVKKISLEDPAREKESGKQYLAFISTRHNGTESTIVMRLQDHERGFQAVGSPLALSDHFYHQQELAARIATADDGRTLFDDVTPPQTSQEEYSRKYEKSGVHIDVLASRPEKIIRRLSKPIKEIDLLSQYVFREYGYGGQITEPSGLYERNNKTEPLLVGQLLLGKQGLDVNTAPAYLYERASLNVDVEDSTALKEKKPLGLSVAVMGMDPDFKSGATRVHLQVVAATDQGQHFAKLDIPLGTNLKRFDGFKLIQGSGENAHRLFVAFSVKPSEKNEQLDKGGAYVIPLEIGASIEKKGEKKTIALTVNRNEPIVLSHEWIAMSELRARLLHEKSSGEPCYELSQDLSSADPNYEVLSFVSGKKWKPNISNNPNIKIERNSNDERYRKGQGWRIFGRNTGREIMTQISRGDPTEYRQDALPDLTKIMSAMVEPGAPVSHTILLVNKTLKSYVLKLLMARYADDAEKTNPKRWNHRNNALPLYLLDAKDVKDQARVLENLDSIREMRGRPILVADLQDVIKAGEPQIEGNDGFHIRDFKTRPDAQNAAEGGDVQVQTNLRMPSLFYLLATEGERIDVQKFLKRGPEHWKISQILVATREELADAKQKIFEERYGVLDSYKILDIGDATPEVRRNLMRQGLEIPEIASLELRYDATEIVRNVQGLSNEQQRDLLLEYIVRKAERYAVDEGQDVFNALVRMKIQLQHSLLGDEWIRKNRVVNLQYLSRVFAQVFRVPLVLKNLPTDDLLQKAARPNAVVEWQKTGYTGDFTLKRKILQTILGQLTPDDAVKVPASFLIVGPSRTGKTFLWETLVKMLGLKMYNFYKTAEENEGAQAIVIGLTKQDAPKDGALDIKVDKDTDTNLSIEAQLKHLEHLLASKNGHRAFILFDDVHLLPPRERKIVLDWIRKHLDNKYYVAQSTFNQKTVFRPTTNLAIFVTLNPPDDLSRIREFDPDWHSWSRESPDPVAMARAALHDKECPIEDSFFNRFKMVFPINRFAIGAKGPALIESVSKLSSNMLENSGNLFLVAPEVVSRLVTTFPEENAKNFISDTSSALIQVASRQNAVLGGGGASILTTLPAEDGEPVETPNSQNSLDPQKRQKKANIGEYVEKHVQALPLDDGYAGKLELLRLMLDSFRVRVFEEFVQELTQNENFALDQKIASSLLAPSLYGLGRHMMDRPVLSLKELRLDPMVFGARTPADRSEFLAELDAVTKTEPKGFFPDGFDRTPRIAGLVSLVEGKTSNMDRYPVQDILRGSVKEVYQHVFKTFERALQVDSIQPFPKPRDWLGSLRPASAEDNPYRALAKELAKVFDGYRQSILQPRNFSGVAQANIPDFYDVARLFGYVIDRAITQLPWSESTSFMAQAFDVMKDDMNLAETRGVQDFFFVRPTSLLRPTTKDLVLESVLSSPVVQEIGEKREKDMSVRFGLVCNEILKAR